MEEKNVLATPPGGLVGWLRPLALCARRINELRLARNAALLGAAASLIALVFLDVAVKTSWANRAVEMMMYGAGALEALRALGLIYSQGDAPHGSEQGGMRSIALSLALAMSLVALPSFFTGGTEYIYRPNQPTPVLNQLNDWLGGKKGR